jgi:signal transduction histidine kinase/CheY-like chemotaxis protein
LDGVLLLVNNQSNNIPTGATATVAETDQASAHLFQAASPYLQSFILNSREPFWTVDKNLTVLFCNEAFKEYVRFQYKIDIEVGLSCKVLVEHSYNPEQWINFFTKSFSGVASSEVFTAGDFVFKVESSPIKNEANEVIAVAFFSINISESKKGEESLLQMGLNLQTMIDNTNGFIWSIDKDYKIQAFNAKFVGIIKAYYGLNITKGFDVRDLLTLANNPVEWPVFYERALSGESFIDDYISNGEYFDVNASPIRNKYGEVIGAAFYSLNITRRKLAEEKLQQISLNLQTLIDNTEGSTWSIGVDYQIITANSVYIGDMKRIFGIDVVPGFDMTPVVKRPDYPKEWLLQYDKVFGGESFKEEYIFNGLNYELQAVPIVGPDGKVLGSAFHARNITARKQNERELIKAKEKAEEATQSKAQFLSNMSHELRTPLNGIIGLSNILLSEPYLPQQKEYLETLKYSSDHMLSLVDDILDFNKIEAGKVELGVNVFNLKSTLEKLMHVFINQGKEKKLQVNVMLDEQLDCMVVGDLTRLRQVLNNLLSNAVKFTLKGSVSLKVLAHQQNANQLAVDFSVKDSGIGIPSAHLERIFDSFTQADARTTRKFGGTGLGLTISKRLVQLMGGSLNVESVHGKGSEFSFSLSFEYAKMQHLNNDADSNKAINEFTGLKNRRILVAEDNAVNMLVAKSILKKWEIDITPVENGKQAVEAMGNNAFDLVLMDLEMPVMDGRVAVKHIREKGNLIPIIALTAASFSDLKTELYDHGFDDFIQKPFRLEDLYEKICQHMKVAE